MKELNPIRYDKTDKFPVKDCNKCKKTYSIDMFNKSSAKKSGLRGDCKICQKKIRKNYSSKNYDADKEYFRKALPLYNITKEEYLVMYKNQRGNCKICGINEDSLKRRLHIDHCHTTGKVRGLLCVKCNSILGRVDDNIKLLQKAIKYLRDSEAK